MRKFLMIVLSGVLSWSLCYASGVAGETETGHPDASAQKEIHGRPISIRGLRDLDAEDIYRVLGVKVPSWFEFWKSGERRILDPLIPSIGETLRGYLDSKGYYNAVYRIEVLPHSVKIEIDEHKPVRVSEVNISSDFPIRDLITFAPGDPFETDTFTGIKQAIGKALRREGYCSYDLDAKAYVDLERRSAALVYRLAKGDLCRFGNTTVTEKPEGISDAVILSRMRYRPGDLFTTERINESYAALNDLGTFGHAVIDTEKKFFNVIPPEVRVRLREKMHRFSVALGIDTVSGPGIRAEYTHYNFFGGARKAGLKARYGSDIRDFSADFFQPALFAAADRYFDYYVTGGYHEESYDDYDEEKLYLDTKFRHAEGRWNYDLGIGLERTRIVLTRENDGIIPGNFTLLYPYFTLTYDGRDSRLDPRNGYYLSLYLEPGYSRGEEETDFYYKMLLEAHVIRSFSRLTVAGVGHFGIVDDGGTASLPASKFLYAGGAYSNRAYGERDIGITVSPTGWDSLGGRTWLNFTAETQFPLYGEFYGAFFYDATMISEKAYDFSSDWIQSGGAGLRYMTPIGPLKIDFAVNLRDPGDNRASLMIGQSF